MSDSSAQPPIPPIHASDLHIAVIKGNLRHVKKMLKAGVGVNDFAFGPPTWKQRNDAGTFNADSKWSPLMLSVAEHHSSIVKVLLEAGADVSALLPNGETILMQATNSGNLEIVKLLLKVRPEGVDTPNKGGNVALYVAAGLGREVIVDILIASGANVNRVNGRGSTALSCAAICGHKICVESLLRAGADVDIVDEGGLGAMHYAAQRGFIDVVRILARGRTASDLNRVNSIGATVLASACSFGRLDVIDFLLRHGADPFIEGAGGATAFHEAIDISVFKLLIDGRESKAAAFVDKDGNTLFHQAVREKRPAPFLCALYKAGVDLAARNERGSTAGDFARFSGQVDTIKLLDLFEAKDRCRKTAPVSTVLSHVEAVEADVEVQEKVEDSSIRVTGSNEDVNNVSVDVVSPDVEVEQLASDYAKACIVESPTDEKVKDSSIRVTGSNEEGNVSVDNTQDAEPERRHRRLRPCLHCQTLTHRRCARCRTTFICSVDCQSATTADHKPVCLEISAKRQARKAAEA